MHDESDAPEIDETKEDTGTILHVPPEQRLDVDDDDSTHAKTGGLDDEGLDELRSHGNVVEERDLQ